MRSINQAKNSKWKRLFHSYFWLYSLFFIFTALQFYFLRDKTQSWYFQDETEHLTLGFMMAKFGKQLYQDLSTNHQPLPILFGYFFNLIFSSDILFGYIERLRLALFAWHFLGGIYLVWRFKKRGLLTAIFYQSLNYYFLGHYILAESLVAPLLAILFNFFFEKEIKTLDLIVIGLSIFASAFNLLPLWPLLFFFCIYFFLKIPKEEKLARQIFLISLLLPTTILFLWINPLLWFSETVINLSRYYLPYLTSSDPSNWKFLKLIFYPFLAFGEFNHLLSFFFIAADLILLFAWLKFKKQRSKILISYLLIISTNLRISQFPKTFYEGFHILPLIASFSSLTAYLWLLLWQNGEHKWRWLYLTWIFLLISSANTWTLEKKDKLVEHNINYSLFQTYGEALKTISAPGDTLLTGADGVGFMNQVANLPFADRQNFHLEWSYRSPQLRAEFEEMLEKNPPTFIFFTPNTSSHYTLLREKMKSEYIELQKDACGCACPSSNLFMRRDKLDTITQDQWNAFDNTVFMRESVTSVSF